MSRNETSYFASLQSYNWRSYILYAQSRRPTSVGKYEGEDLTLAVSVKEDIYRLDVGVEGGIGYYLRKRDGVYVGIRYYQGLRNVQRDVAQMSQLNSSFFLYASIPIGAGEKSKAKQAEAKKKKEAKKAAKEAEKAEKK